MITSVSNGVASTKKDSLMTYLSKSERARKKFSAITSCLIQMSPPGKLRKGTDDINVEVNDLGGTMTVTYKLATLTSSACSEGWGPKTDDAMALCCLSDTYIDKAKLTISQVMSETGVHLPGLEGDVDFSFIEDANFVKLDESARQAAINSCATAFKAGMLTNKTGLVRYLARSKRATTIFQNQIKSVHLCVDGTNKCKAPYELTEDGGCLKVLCKLSGIGSLKEGWGPAIEDRFNLQVIDEEGMRNLNIVAEQLATGLPAGTRIDFDWSDTLQDKWRKMKDDDKDKAYTDMAKRLLPLGINDRKEGITGYLNRSARAKSIFASKVAVVRVKMELSGKPQAMLLEGGVLVLSWILKDVGSNPNWGSLMDPVLDLLVVEEETMRKMLTNIEKAAYHVPVICDWSFMDDPTTAKNKIEKKVDMITAFYGFIKSGLDKKFAVTLPEHCDKVVVRANPTVKAKEGVDLRLGSDRVLEATVKVSALTSSKSVATSWKDAFEAIQNDGAECIEVPEYHLLGEGDIQAACSVENPGPSIPNPLLDEGADPYTTTPTMSGSTASSAPPLKDVAKAPVAAAPVARAPKPKAAAPPAAKPAPTPTAAAPNPSSPAPLSTEGVPNDYGCPTIWNQLDQICSTMNKTLGCAVRCVVDWSFLECDAFGKLNDGQKKAAVSSLNQRVFTALSKDLTKIGKSHAFYSDAVKALTEIRFAYDTTDSVMDLSSGKQNKTHYQVQLFAGGILDISCNFNQFMAGIIPALEGKLQVAFNIHHLVLLDQATQAVARRGKTSNIECYLNQTFVDHENYFKKPITMDTILSWNATVKEIDTGLDKLLKACDQGMRDPIFHNEFKSRFSSVLVVPDPSNSIRDTSNPVSWNLTEDKEKFQLIFSFNLNDGSQAGQAALVKINDLVDVKLAQAIFAARKDADEQMLRFKQTIPGVECSLIDFFETNDFKQLPVDRALEGCKFTKTFLAGAIRQMGSVVSRNATVFKNKVNSIELGLDPLSSIRGAHEATVEMVGEQGVLRIVQNMASANKCDPTITQRVDGLLDVTLANATAETEAELTQRSASLSSSLQTPGLTVGIDFGFEQMEAFTSLTAQEKQLKIKKMRTHVQQILDALVKNGGPACVGLAAVMFGIDPENSINDPLSGANDGAHYSCKLDKDGLLQVITNWDMLEKSCGRLAHKIENQLALHRARQDKYHNGPEYFDWESHYYPPLINDLTLINYEKSIEHCKEAVRVFAQSVEHSRSTSPAGKESLSKMKTIFVRMLDEVAPPWATAKLDDSTLVLNLNFGYVKDLTQHTQLEWKEALEWTLGSTVEVEKHYAIPRVEKAKAALKKAFGADVPVTIDWATYVDRPEFLHHGAAGCRKHIRTLSIEVLENIIQSIIRVCGHPVGMEAIKKKCKSVLISYGPQVDQKQRLRQPAKVVLKDDGCIFITFRDLFACVDMDFKARIEFELEIVCAVAEYNMADRRKAVSTALSGIPITHDPEFQLTDEFKYGILISNQPKIIHAVVADIAERVWGHKDDGLLSVWDRASKKVKGCTIKVSRDGSLDSVFGQLKLAANGILELTVDLGCVLEITKGECWRPRIMDTIGLLDELAHFEADAKLALVSKEVSVAPVSIDWSSFEKAPQWLELPAADRYERMHVLGSSLARNVLLGYWGISGLMAFPNVKAEFTKRVKKISLCVDAAAPLSGNKYKTELDGTTLKVIFNMEELRGALSQDTHWGCRERLEKLMGLRALVEKCVMDEITEGRAKPVADTLCKEVLFDWDFMKNDDYLQYRDYVAYLRYIGTMMSPLWLGGAEPEGIPWMLDYNSHAVELYAPIKQLIMKVDGDCKTRPPQVRFVNGNMKAELDGSKLTVTVRRDWMEISDSENGMTRPPYTDQTHHGCGAVVGWLLGPGIMESKELQHLDRYRDQLIELEEDRRASELDDWENTCRRNTERYNDEMQRYARAATEKCSSCQGRGYWGKNHNKCSSCKQTGNNQAKMTCPKMPHNPPQPRFVELMSINWMGLAEAETSYNSVSKIEFSSDAAPMPSSPKFTEIFVKWSKHARESLGGEDKRPAEVPAKPIHGSFKYAPVPIIENNWGFEIKGAAGQAGGSVSPSTAPKTPTSRVSPTRRTPSPARTNRASPPPSRVSPPPKRAGVAKSPRAGRGTGARPPPPPSMKKKSTDN